MHQNSFPHGLMTALTLVLFVLLVGGTWVYCAHEQQPDAALTLRIPLSQTEVTAGKALSGIESVVQGRDYPSELRSYRRCKLYRPHSGSSSPT